MTEIFLREIIRADIPLINQWRADQETLGQLGAPFRHVGIETDERWFDAYLSNRANNVRMAICRNNGSGAAPMVGVVYLLGMDWLNRSAEFAIWLGDRKAHGQGVGEAATRLALAHAFHDLNLERIHLTVLTDNARAIRLYQKVGFVEEGTLRRATFKQGCYRDLKLMAVLREDFITKA